MSLRFLRVTLDDFGPYKGSQSVELSTPDGSPVVLIHGENTLGKTQFFAALRWCLYGTFEPLQSPQQALTELPNRLNRISRREGKSQLGVTIDFVANDEPYRLARTASIEDGRSKVSADLRIGATVVPSSSIDGEIGRLLHPQISEFFLFDAELMKRFYDRLATAGQRALIKSSIEAVLGSCPTTRSE